MSKKKKIFITFGVIIALTIIGLGVYFIVNPRENEVISSEPEMTEEIAINHVQRDAEWFTEYLGPVMAKVYNFRELPTDDSGLITSILNMIPQERLDAANEEGLVISYAEINELTTQFFNRSPEKATPRSSFPVYMGDDGPSYEPIQFNSENETFLIPLVIFDGNCNFMWEITNVIYDGTNVTIEYYLLATDTGEPTGSHKVFLEFNPDTETYFIIRLA